MLGDAVAFVCIVVCDIAEDRKKRRKGNVLVRVIDLNFQQCLLFPKRIDINLKIELVFRQTIAIFANLPQ